MACSSRFLGSVIPASLRCSSILGSHHAPHLIEGVHIEGKAVQLSVVIGNRRIGEPVELSEPCDIVPDLLVIGMEDMGAIDMDVDALHFLCIHIARDVGPLVDHQHLFSGIGSFPGEHSAIQTGTDHQMIVFHHQHLFISVTIHAVTGTAWEIFSHIRPPTPTKSQAYRGPSNNISPSGRTEQVHEPAAQEQEEGDRQAPALLFQKRGAMDGVAYSCTEEISMNTHISTFNAPTRLDPSCWS